MKLPRIIHKWWANLFGYYWLPCPICKEYMGGHEFSFEKSGVLRTSHGSGYGTCHKCKPEATRRNIEHGFGDFIGYKDDTGV